MTGARIAVLLVALAALPTAARGGDAVIVLQDLVLDAPQAVLNELEAGTIVDGGQSATNTGNAAVFADGFAASGSDMFVFGQQAAGGRQQAANRSLTTAGDAGIDQRSANNLNLLDLDRTATGTLSRGRVTIDQQALDHGQQATNRNRAGGIPTARIVAADGGAAIDGDNPDIAGQSASNIVNIATLRHDGGLASGVDIVAQQSLLGQSEQDADNRAFARDGILGLGQAAVNVINGAGIELTDTAGTNSVSIDQQAGPTLTLSASNRVNSDTDADGPRTTTAVGQAAGNFVNSATVEMTVTVER